MRSSDVPLTDDPSDQIPVSVSRVRPSQPTFFTSQRPPPLTTPTPFSPSATNHPASPPPPSSPSSSASSSSSPAPLVLSPSDLSSIVTLKHNYDTLLTQHATLLTTLTQRDTQLARLHSQHRAEEADWEQRAADGREQYERVMRDWSEESERRRKLEDSERRWKQQQAEALHEQRRAERSRRLLEADLSNERRMGELLRERLQQVDHQLAQTAASASSSTKAASVEGATNEDGADTSLLSVHKAVLSRRVQRLEMELTAANEQLVQQQAINAQHVTALDEINTHLAAISQQPSVVITGTAAEQEGKGEMALMAEAECVVLRERLRYERRDGWKRERKLYCFVLVWLVAMLSVSVGGLLCS